MEILKIAALALCAVMLIVLVKNYKPEFGVLTAVACSIIILYFLADSLKYAFAYMSQLYGQLKFGKAYFPVIIKVLAIAYITEFTSQLCKDAGESAIASKVELAGKIIIFCVAIPVFVTILDLIEQLL
ncbi:SpoIIIAC/SpoIIIAD family protein [Ihubacter sp. rT4E-8]|uniref:SpoIIIAC/SpoIIIAD family protein n=1 Tax=unclassified Ihubacter TaxID=2633299 RepID=UPI0013795165